MTLTALPMTSAGRFSPLDMLLRHVPQGEAPNTPLSTSDFGMFVAMCSIIIVTHLRICSGARA